MKIRFRHTTESDRPEYPFQAGQIIALPRLNRKFSRWLKEQRIEIVQDEPERAIVDETEQAVLRG